MKKKTFKKHRQRCRRLFDRWLSCLGLRYWHIEIEYYDNETEFRKADDACAVMRAWAQWQYFELRIAVNVPAVKRMDDSRLEYVVVHELVHGIVNELREDDPTGKHEERVVSGLAKAFIWTRDLTKGDQ